MSSLETVRPHMVLIPSAGMGHLVPFTRLAAALSGQGCGVSVLHVLPTVSAAESQCYGDLFAEFPSVRPLTFQLPEFDSSAFEGADPFFLRMEAMRRTANHIASLLAEASPISALVVDIALASSVIPIAKELHLPGYILFTSSAAMFSLLAYFPSYLDTKMGNDVGYIDIPGLWRVPKASIPQALHDPGHLFTNQFVENARSLLEANGILINTFQALEPLALSALQDGLVMPGLPPVFAVGPLMPAKLLKHQPTGSPLSAWLDEQPVKSVIYVSFGSRTAMPRDQIKQLASGLETSGCRFLWVVKSTVVDINEEVELAELLGDGYLDRVKGRGLVTKGWVEQEYVLKHAAIGFFLGHCGWNSVTESATQGIPILSWPRLGDQRVNADVVRRSGLGVWIEQWSWQGEEKVVSGEEIAKVVREVMADGTVKTTAARVSKEAAVAGSGSLVQFVEKFKSK